MRDRDEEAGSAAGRESVLPRPIDESAAPGDPAGFDGAVGTGRGRSRIVTVTWLVAIVAFALFIGFGSVTVEAGARPGRSLRVVEVWRRFLADLPESGHATLLRLVVLGTVAALLVGSALGLWLAVNAAADPAHRSPAGDPGGA